VYSFWVAWGFAVGQLGHRGFDEVLQEMRALHQFGIATAVLRHRLTQVLQAILAREFGGPNVLKLEQVPDPTAGPGQVRVRIHAVGVNPYDTYMRAGGYAIKPDLPYTPGADAAGVIDQVGDGVHGLKAGARVYISGTTLGKAHGAYAQIAFPVLTAFLFAGVSTADC